VKGLDTNVLVRYFTQDHPGQAARANALIAGAARRGERCAVGGIVLCELVWVLEDAYGFERATIAGLLERMLDTAEFVVEDRDSVVRALVDFRKGPGDFSDYLIGWRNRDAGCAVTATFDHALRGSALFTVLA
jgi:predicted nucleic-acid-binding protein